jgi:hypothetical protein
MPLSVSQGKFQRLAADGTSAREFLEKPRRRAGGG